MKKLIVKLATGTFWASVFACLMITGAAAYTDVPATHWAHASIQTMSEKGIMQGVSRDSFRPEGAITRAEFLATVTRALVPEQLDTSVPGPWYAANYKAAVDAGLIARTEMPETAQSMGTNITRFEMARILVRADENINKNGAATADTTAISDYASIPTDYRYFVEQAYAKGLLTGDDFGRFNGARHMTRAQAAVVMEWLLAAASAEPPYDRDEFLKDYQRIWDNTPYRYQRTGRPTRMPELGEQAEQYLAYIDLYFPADKAMTQTVHYRLLDAETNAPLPYATLYIWAMDNADVDNQYFVMPVRSDKNGEITITLKRDPIVVSYILCGAEHWTSSSSWGTDVTVGNVKYSCDMTFISSKLDGSQVYELLFTAEIE